MTWAAAHWPVIVRLAGQHLALALPAIAASVLIAVPVGYLARQQPAWGRPLLTATTLLYSIPALPLLLVVPALLGLPIRSPATMITVLTIYGVALLIRTSADAFGTSHDGAREAAVALGHSPAQLFWRVRLPLAIPVLAAGLRVVAVSTVGLVTIGALVGVPSLGLLITDGFQRGITASVATGVLATALLGLTLDLVVAGAAHLLAPWQRAFRPDGALAGAGAGSRFSRASIAGSAVASAATASSGAVNRSATAGGAAWLRRAESR